MREEQPHRKVFRKQPLAERVADYIRANMVSGYWKAYLPPERALSREVSASRPVLRQALHRLRDEGWLRITPGQPTRILRGRRAGTRRAQRRVVLVATQEMIFSEMLFSPLTQGLRKELSAHGFLVDTVLDKRLNRGRPDRLLRFLAEQHRADYWILYSVPRPVQAWFQERGLPALVMGHPFPGTRLPFVDGDHRAIARHAAGVFFRLGHRRIAALHWASNTASRGAMEEGLREAARGEPSADLRVFPHDGTVRMIQAHVKALIEAPNPPTAILSFHAVDMLTIMPVLLSSGLRIPEEVSLLALTSAPYIDRLVPRPAYYQQNPEVYARQLMRLIENPSSREEGVLLFPSLEKGETLAPPPRRRQPPATPERRPSR